jgi:hypothetical protein
MSGSVVPILEKREKGCTPSQFGPNLGRLSRVILPS